MDFVKNQFERIQQQLAGLSASQKMLAACLVVIMVMTVVWWGRYAASPEMRPLVDRSLSPEDVGRIRASLDARGIKSEVTGDNRILVPAEQSAAAIADLTFSQLLPKGNQISFDTLVKGMSPFAPASMTKAHLNHLKQTRLAEVISNFPGVKSAQVFIDSTERVAVGGGVQPSATVAIEMRPGEQAPQKLVDAAANLLRGAEAGLKAQRVSVVIDGVARGARDGEQAAMHGADYANLERSARENYANEILRLLQIPRLSVSVSVKVETRTRHSKSRMIDKDKTIKHEVENEDQTSEATVPAAAQPQEPGAVVNTAIAIAPTPAGGAAAVTNENRSRTRSEILPSHTDEEVFDPAGVAQAVAAAVRVPRSYIINILKQERPANAPEPDEKMIQDRFNVEMADIRAHVKNGIGLDSVDKISVSMVTDLAPMVPGGPGGAAAGVFSTATLAGIAGAHSREIVLGGLALVSLFMVSMMVRRGGPLPAAIAADSPMMPMPVLDAAETLVGEVSEGRSMLDAMELDEGAVRAQQMVDQVSAMVEENPDGAASLVKRWLNRA